MMKTEVMFGPSADIYSFGVVMWEVWSRRKPWSELCSNQEIFKAVKEDKRCLNSPNEGERIEGYEKLMRSCTEYKASRRPLIDSVRSDLQALLERAAESDHEKTVHREDYMSRSRMLFDMTRGGDSSKRRSSETNRSTTGSSLQSNNSTKSSVQIEMGTLSSSTDGGGFEELDSKGEVGETPLRL